MCELLSDLLRQNRSYIAELQDQVFEIKESYPDSPPTDTQMVCDLIENPDSNEHFEISL